MELITKRDDLYTYRMSVTTGSLVSPREAFFHLIYDCRYLAVAGSAWKQYGPRGSTEDQKRAITLIPGGAAVLIQDSLHLHARSLIGFLAKPAKKNDLSASVFGISFSRQRKDLLLKRFDQISVHSMHETHWRDSNYRTMLATTMDGKTRQRPDWNTENDAILTEVLDALEEASNIAALDWRKSFRDLHEATARQLVDSAFEWPRELTKKAYVHAYLAAQGLR